MSSLKIDIDASPDAIEVHKGLWNGRLLEFDVLTSTNKWAMANLEASHHGDAILANHQTQGLGRQGRKWLSPRGQGLTVSYIIKPIPDEKCFPILPIATGLAVHKTLSTVGIDARLKWPNDVLVGEKKICGILAEIDFVKNGIVIGIGLNINSERHDLESLDLDRSITSMRLERGRSFGIKTVREKLTLDLEKTLDQLFNQGPRPILESWAKKDWLIGEHVILRTSQTIHAGQWDGLDERGRCCIIGHDKIRRAFWSGDVEKVRINLNNFSL